MELSTEQREARRIALTIAEAHCQREYVSDAARDIAAALLEAEARGIDLGNYESNSVMEREAERYRQMAQQLREKRSEHGEIPTGRMHRHSSRR